MLRILPKIVFLTIALMLVGVAVVPAAPQVQAIDNRCYYNPFFALGNPDACGTGSENPYCKDGDCSVSKGVEQTGQEIQGPAKTTDAKELILGWLQFFLSFLFIIAVVAIVAAGVMMVTSFGNDSKRQKATKIIIWTVGGLVLILMAYAIVTTVLRAVG